MTRTCLMVTLLLAVVGCGTATPAQTTARPTVRITSPISGAKLSTQTVTVHLAVSQFTLIPDPAGPEQAGSGQVWIYANGRIESRLGSSTATLILAPGTYALKAVLVTNGKVVASSAPVVVSVTATSGTSAATSTASCANSPTPSTGLKAGIITWFCKGLPSGLRLGRLTAGPDGDLWFALRAFPGKTGSIGRITPAGVITVFRRGLRSGGSPGSLTVGPDGNLWFAETLPNGGTGAMGRITPSGAITMFSQGLPAGSQLGNLVGGPDGNLWFTDCVPAASLNPPCSPTIGRITPSGTITVFTKGMPSYSWPNSLVVGPDGNLWFTGTESAMLGGSLAIGRITPSGVVTLFTKGLSAFNQLHSITVGPDGDLWVSANLQSSGAGAIGRVTPAGSITWFDKGLPPTADVGRVVAGPDGNLWFPLSMTSSTGFNGAIGRITPSGRISLFTTGLPSGSQPGNLAVGPDGNLWFVDSTVNRDRQTTGSVIGRITATGAITMFHRGLPALTELTTLIGGPGGSLWFIDQVPDGQAAIGRIIP
ncbi:MAG: Vgb family protein [Sulfobacillus sp.]